MNPELPMLVVSRAFAPDREIGAKRITRFCTYLPDYGIRPVVLTVHERFLEYLDKDFVPPNGIRVERTTEWRSPLFAYAWLKRRISLLHAADNLPTPNQAAQPPRGDTSRDLRRHALSLLSLPDRYQGWYFPALRAGSWLIEHERIGAILSSAPPFTSHLIARQLSKKYGIPWAADFRDGWATNPFWVGSPQWAISLNARMEASCVKWADLVVCNTEPLRCSFVQRYPLLEEGKFVTLTNGYDDAVKPLAVRVSDPGAKLLLHFGSLYGHRRIGTFCKTVSNLVSTGKLNPNSFRILFHGDIDSFSLAGARQHASDLIDSRIIEFEPFIDSWQEAQGILWNADLLLLFPGSALEVPAKFYEYLKTGKPIFAVAENGALTDLLDLTGSGVWAEPDDLDGIAAGLLEALQMEAVPPEEVARRWDHQFHFRSLTERLAHWIWQVASVPVDG